MLSSSLGEEDVLLPKSPVLHNRTVSIHLVVMMVIPRIQMMVMLMVIMMVVVLTIIYRMMMMVTRKMRDLLLQ